MQLVKAWGLRKNIPNLKFVLNSVARMNRECSYKRKLYILPKYYFIPS